MQRQTYRRYVHLCECVCVCGGAKITGEFAFFALCLPWIFRCVFPLLVAVVGGTHVCRRCKANTPTQQLQQQEANAMQLYDTARELVSSKNSNNSNNRNYNETQFSVFFFSSLMNSPECNLMILNLRYPNRVFTWSAVQSRALQNVWIFARNFCIVIIQPWLPRRMHLQKLMHSNGKDNANLFCSFRFFVVSFRFVLLSLFFPVSCRDFATAATHCQNSIEISTHTFGEDSVQMGYEYAKLAQLLFNSKQVVEAMNAIEKVKRRVLSPSHSHCLLTLSLIHSLTLSLYLFSLPSCLRLGLFCNATTWKRTMKWCQTCWKCAKCC